MCSFLVLFSNLTPWLQTASHNSTMETLNRSEIGPSVLWKHIGTQDFTTIQREIMKQTQIGMNLSIE